MVRYKLSLTAVAVVVSAMAAFPVQARETPASSAHVAKAKLAAAPDFADLAEGFLCKSPKEGFEWLFKNISMTKILPPMRGADNLYYIGKEFVGSWVLDTGKGLIVWDALNNGEEARDILVPGLRSLRFKPEDIKHLIVTHGHYDHMGGARYMQQTYGTPILMSAADWDFVATNPSVNKNIEPPRRDRIIKDGEQLTVNGQTVTFLVTPGHTPGTTSSLLTVKVEGKPVVLTMWGGTAMPTGVAELAAYHNSLHKFWDAGKAAGAVGTISTHLFITNNLKQLQLFPTRKDALVIGPAKLDRLMQFYDECTVAEQARRAEGVE